LNVFVALLGPPDVIPIGFQNRQINLPLRPLLINFYCEPAVNLVRLAFDPCPFDSFIIVATPERHRLAANGDDNIALAGAVVTTYPYFGSMFGDH
jgi:hypothetical protein